ncbi:polysaccharide pyruvyl transferase family protein [Leucobacter sp. cx-42]|uniref:polysaccharide pyruvyl transferase family protein n=1 Tax=unclassified Leucobacter TaxID=2621730 RepID=UPI00165D5688|nr:MULTISPECIES: polysaccharide pyruvyl transferase family protein [unclassified Leucobacter]MBC9954302.1 polysaccharide pyruvyl transferase family protein [Leucobacter sp. cx-42]
MSRILMRSGKSPLIPLTPEASLAAARYASFGTNSGNLLFSNSVARAISVPGTEVISDSFRSERAPDYAALAARINNEFDGFVIPLANAFRRDFVPFMNRLTDLISRLTIPVTVVGVGAQLTVDGDHFANSGDVDEATKRFVGTVLDRSATVGVRGELTLEYLKSLGFNDGKVDVIGCPSTYDLGRDFTIEKPEITLDRDSRVAFNTSRAARGAGAFIRKVASEFPRSEFVGQQQDELSTLLWGTSVPSNDPNLITSIDHPLIREDRVRFFVDPITWTQYLGEMDFSFGARIHGNVAAIMGGTPAYVLGWDSRTLELADYHGIPHRLVRDLSTVESAAEIYENLDYSEFNRKMPENFDRYTSFLEKNEIAHIYQPGNSNPEFDDQMASLNYPGPVHGPFSERSTEQIYDRLRWLRQGADAEDKRRNQGYTVPFMPPPAKKLAPAPNPDLEAQKRATTALQKELKSLRSQVQVLQEKPSLSRRILNRVKRIFRTGTN